MKDKASVECDHRYTDEIQVLAVGQYGSIVVQKEVCLMCDKVVAEEIIDNSGNIEPKRSRW